MIHNPKIVFERGPLDGLDSTVDPLRALVLAELHGYVGALIRRHVDDDSVCEFVFVWKNGKGGRS